MYTIFTDGSSIGNPGPAGWAAYCPELDKELSGGMQIATNNEAEMTAVLYGLSLAPDGSQVTVVTDSKLVIGWLAQRWNTKSNPKIGEIRKSIWMLVQSKGLRVGFRKTSGHSDDHNNNRVDNVARLEARAKQCLPRSEDRGMLEVTLRITGLDMDCVPDLVRAIESLGGIASGLIEQLDNNLAPVRTKEIKDNRY